MIKCTFPDGNPAELRHISCDMIVVKDNKILLAKRSEDSSSEPNKWCVPGGFLDRNENIKTACLRELKEETGYEGEIEKLMLIEDNPNRMSTSISDNQNVTFVFIIKIGEKTGESDHEISEIKWFDINDLPDKIAFDHENFIRIYKKYCEEGFALPLLGGNDV